MLTAPLGKAMSIESESRQAKVLMLYARGLTQIEIAEQLGVQQSTVRT
jgi:DNA-binding NarL/FixJ family response regulator